jgi:hypothetical protein
LGSQPVALEVGVEVSGSHTASDTGARALFTEKTVTTLAFEDGVVVRLSAAVEDGQLLFLKHLDSQREIVTRVLRQRRFGAANPYVELEFTEEAPDFWGMDLDAARNDANAAEEPVSAEVAREFLASEQRERELQTQAVLPDAGEVARLREELAALRSQMSSLMETSAAPPSQSPAKTRAVAEPAEPSAPEAAAAETNDVPSEPAPEAAAPKDSSVITTLLGRGPATEDAAAAPGSVASKEPRKDISAEEPTGSKLTPRVRLLAALLLLVLVGGVAYQKGVLANLMGAPSIPDAGGGLRPRGRLNVAQRLAASVKSALPNGSASAADSTASTSNKPDESANGRHDSSATTASIREAERRASGDHAALQEQGGSVATNSGQASGHAAGTLDASAVPAPEIAPEAYEAPSLLKAVNAVAPPDAVRSFVTGDVKCDALVDVTGKVTSVKAISGPAPLRAAAVEAVRGYQYKPATKNGQPVAAHVTATVKFWYEP